MKQVGFPKVSITIIIFLIIIIAVNCGDYQSPKSDHVNSDENFDANESERKASLRFIELLEEYQNTSKLMPFDHELHVSLHHIECGMCHTKSEKVQLKYPMDILCKECHNTLVDVGSIPFRTNIRDSLKHLIDSIADYTPNLFEIILSEPIKEGYRPSRPITFNHKIHAGQEKIECEYCHNSGSEKNLSRGIPSPDVCLDCHKMGK